MICAAIFDIDGTLVDSVDLHARAWREAFLHFGKNVPLQDVHAQMGKGGDQLLPVFFSEAELSRFGKELEAYRGAIYQRDYLPQVRALPGIRPLFEKISGDGIAIGLASSAKADEVAVYKRLAQIDDLVQSETSADDVQRSKPYPDIFQAALAAMGHPDVASVMVVGDTPYDAQAAGKIGLPTIGVLSGGFPADWLKTSGCIAIYADAADLLAHYPQSPFAAP
ncbi:MAG TPA: HAD family hydrolase [Polyangia bacterium]|jgi:HAD superfamily hydrolase (TIGR01549 family)|nr:HAD family hydrolase [Polyangia bacterium]